MYDDKSIRALSDKEHVQLRASMYISPEKPHLQMFSEIFDNANDEALNGYATEISVTIDYDNEEITIIDNGRGIPQGINKELNIPTVAVIYGKLNAGGKYNQDSYDVSGGLHGVGSSVVNFLSRDFSVTSWRNSKAITYYWIDGDLSEGSGPTKTSLTDSGTKVSFSIGDHSIFTGKTLLDAKKDIENKVKISATLIPNCKYYLNGELQVPGEDPSKFLPEVENHTSLISIKVGAPTRKRFTYLVMYWDKDNNKTFTDSYANLVHTVNGGDHVKAVEEALVSLYGNTDILWGLNLFLSSTYPGIAYDGQTKTKAVCKELRQELRDQVARAFKSLPEFQEAKELATSKREALTARKTSRRASKREAYLAMLETGFQDAQSKDRSKCILYLTEGRSACGGLVQVRNPLYHACMPLRGKTINAYTNNMELVLKNKEVSTILEAINCGILDKCDPSKSRYSEIVFLTDGDVDGSNIVCLLLTVFVKYMRNLVEAGKVYIARPPLYSVYEKSGKVFFSDKETFDKYSKKSGVTIQRNKGLGEMNPEDLYISTINEETREPYFKVVLDSSKVAENIMGPDSKYRKEILFEKGVLY